MTHLDFDQLLLLLFMFTNLVPDLMPILLLLALLLDYLFPQTTIVDYFPEASTIWIPAVVPL